LAHINDLGDVPSDRRRRDQVALAEGGLGFLAFEGGAGTVFLDRPDGAGVTGRGVAISRLLDGRS
jgi:hypothetical protein